MATRNQTNAEFRNEVQEILGRHESRLDELHSTLQTILAKLQHLEAVHETHITNPNVNLFAQTVISHLFNHTSSSHSPPSTHSHNHHLKLNFPKFDGEDPMGWIYKSEQYFEFKEVVQEHRVQLASFHLEGIALQWHRWFAKFKGPVTWVEFTKALLLRFGPTDYEDPSEALTRLKQNTTVSVYQDEFEKLSHRVDDLPEKFLIGCFVAGLKDGVRLDVKIKQPRTLTDATGVARLIEERNLLRKKKNQPYSSQPTTAGLLGPPPDHKSNSKSPIGFKKITSQEMQDRREKGLCYYCNEKYILGHRCQQPQMFMIEDLGGLTSESSEFYPCGQG